MPGPEQLGPLGAHLVADDVRVVHGPGRVRQRPRDGHRRPTPPDGGRAHERVTSIGAVLAAFIHARLVKAEAKQASAGGRQSALRLASSTRRRPTRCPRRRRSPASSSTIAPRSSRRSSPRSRRGRSPVTASNPATASPARPTHCAPSSTTNGPSRCRRARARRAPRPRPSRRRLGSRSSPTTRGSSSTLHADAAWARATADYATQADRPVRLVTLTDATSPAGRSRAQAAAQLARAAASGTGGHVTAFAASIEAPDADAGPGGWRARRSPPRRARCGRRWPAPSWSWARAGSGCAAIPGRSAP